LEWRFHIEECGEIADLRHMQLSIHPTQPVLRSSGNVGYVAWGRHCYRWKRTAALGRIEPFGGRDPIAALDPSRKSRPLISTFPSSVNRRPAQLSVG
jgi:hypothetical protein